MMIYGSFCDDPLTIRLFQTKEQSPKPKQNHTILMEIMWFLWSIDSTKIFHKRIKILFLNFTALRMLTDGYLFTSVWFVVCLSLFNRKESNAHKLRLVWMLCADNESEEIKLFYGDNIYHFEDRPTLLEKVFFRSHVSRHNRFLSLYLSALEDSRRKLNKNKL